MAIKMRRGAYADFDPSKLEGAELAVVQQDDPNTTDGKAVYIAFQPGQAKRLATYEDIQNEVAQVTEDIAQELTQQFEEAIEDDVQAAQTAATNASTSAQTATTKASEAAASATQAAQTVANIIDPTLTQSGKAADAKVTKDKLTELKEDLNLLGTPPNILESEETEADLYICDSNGNVIAKFENGHIVTKDFDSSIANTVMEASSSEADLYICDSFGNVIAEFANGHIKTKNFDSENASEEILQEVQEELETLSNDVTALQEATSGALYRIKDQTDGIYATCRWHQPNASSKQFCMLMGGDVHYEASRMNNMIELLNGIDAFDAGIMLGDMSGNTFSDTIQFYIDALDDAQKPFLTVLGNHDVVGATSDTDLWNKYGSCLDAAELASGEAVNGKLYYYKDFASQKIRIIVLMQYDYTYTGDICFGQTQIDWLISVLNSTPSDYGVIIAEHTNSSRYMTYDMGEAYTSSTWARSNYAPTVIDGDPVPDIVNAWINGTSLNKTYAYTFTDAPTALSVSVDFASRGTGEFITYIGGHWHMDVLGHPTDYADQMDYHVPATGLNAATQGDIPRKAGTPSEDSLCVIGIDRTKKTVKIFHVGAHYTKDAVDRQYFKYSYGGAS